MSVNLEKLSINIDQQSTLARLLAQENVSVIHGNYRTAWFDPEKRVLALPIWKNRGKAVYDLLTGHEVGHALFTPAQGWHDAVDDIQGAPKAYLNVLEDVRIERKVQDKYPGLRAQFKKAYKQLSEEDFFGLSAINDYDNLLIIDKINIKAKLAEFSDLELSAVEQSFFDRAYKNETFEDVVALAKELYEYQKSLYEKTPEFVQTKNLETSMQDQDGPSENDYEKNSEPSQEDSQESVKSDSEKQEIEGNTQSSETRQFKKSTKDDEQEQAAVESEEGLKESTNQKPEETHDDYEAIIEALTDKAFREKEKELTASDELNNNMVYTLNKVKDDGIIIDYKAYYAQWKKELSELTDWRATSVQDGMTYLDSDFKKFKRETEFAAAYMAKEFELRKAAYQYSRSSIQKTGLLNTNKLHAYKFSDDIFLKATKLANYKNHGMMMFIDFSGSMSDNIGPTIRQILNLTLFCRMANIPFEVYAFTTRVNSDEDFSRQHWKNYFDCEVIHQKFNLLNMLSSRMSRTEYQEGFKYLWYLSMCWDSKMSNAFINSWNQLHSTPLNTCIAYANDLIKQFKTKHSIEKMVTMFLTDGASDTFQVRMTEEGENHRVHGSSFPRYSRSAILRFDGQSLQVGHINSTTVTEQLLQAVKKSTGSVMLGFYISQYRSDAVGRVCDKVGYAKRDKLSEQLNKSKAIIQDNIFGYDRYFGLCTKYLDIVENEFGEMVEDGASKGKLKTAFAKMTKAKRVNRVLLNAFVDSIA